MDSVPDLLGETGYRPRKAHQKSRTGCTQCKERRRKCDEHTPRCSRCAKQNLCCQYVRENLRTDKMPLKREEAIIPSAELEQSPTRRMLAALINGFGSFSRSGYQNESVTARDSPLPPTLGTTEWELFLHFVAHTAHSVFNDGEDLYAMKIGIPILALRSRPVMSAVIALTAMCRCHDIMEQSNMNPADLEQLPPLMLLAERHHRDSIHHIQPDLQAPERSEFVFAHAAVTYYYVFATKCITTRLAEAPTTGKWRHYGLFPEKLRFVVYFRAMHSLYDSMDHPTSKLSKEESHKVEALVAEIGDGNEVEDVEHERLNCTSTEDAVVHPILPDLHATCQLAIQDLRLRANTLAQSSNTGHAAPALDEELDSCFVALIVLCDVFELIFSGALSQSMPGSQPHQETRNRLPESLPLVSPWLHAYAYRLFSASQAHARGPIMQFLHRTPQRFISLVLQALGGEEWDLHDSGALSMLTPRQASDTESVAHQLAVDIFAHWLVLVMLLDRVWWIGPLGSYELKRAIDHMRDTRESGAYSTMGDEWWPERMYDIWRSTQAV